MADGEGSRAVVQARIQPGVCLLMLRKTADMGLDEPVGIDENHLTFSDSATEDEIVTHPMVIGELAVGGRTRQS